MLFSSVTFLYYFLPILLALYYGAPALGSVFRAAGRGRLPGAEGLPLAPEAPSGAAGGTGSPTARPGGDATPFRNGLLLAASLLFYAWGEPVCIALLAAESAAGFCLGLAIEKHRGTPAAKAALFASIVIGIGALGVFKYADFFIDCVGALIHAQLPHTGIAMPIGISFFTFQILSYTIDLYRGDAKVQRGFVPFFTYVALFPQLVAGPIVRYVAVQDALARRGVSLADFAYGARRFAFGLAKKILLANTFGQLSALAVGDPSGSALSAWLYVCAFALQIYFDFSGYSDMAIGLGRMFGFRFPENFDYPYIAQSATGFWRRWHISLSSWFRDYVYIPLGGNRVPLPRHLFNIAAVWFLTGFWHGAGWNFILWGLYYAALLIVEKCFLASVLPALPRPVRHAYLLLAMLVGWVLFDAPSIGSAAATLGAMFGAGHAPAASAYALYYLRSFAVPLAAGAFGCSPLPARIASRLVGARAIGAWAEPAAIAVMLILVSAYLADGSFNPFIYFRF